MTPLLLGAAWLLFVVSCFASMAPTADPKPPTKSLTRPSTKSFSGPLAKPLEKASAKSFVKSKVGGKDEKTT